MKYVAFCYFYWFPSLSLGVGFVMLDLHLSSVIHILWKEQVLTRNTWGWKECSSALQLALRISLLSCYTDTWHSEILLPSWLPRQVQKPCTTYTVPCPSKKVFSCLQVKDRGCRCARILTLLKGCFIPNPPDILLSSRKSLTWWDPTKHLPRRKKNISNLHGTEHKKGERWSFEL